MNTPKQKPPLICRVLGHKWHSRNLYQLGALRTKSMITHPACLRCGEPLPDELFYAMDSGCYPAE